MSNHANTILEIGAVLSAHATAIFISFTDISDGLKIVSLSLAILYTVWKWTTDYKKENKPTRKKRS